MKKLKNKNYGFTLIELLATIVILGLLALIVTPGVAKVIRNSKINTAKASLEGYVREVENAVALYMTDTGDTPTSIHELELDGKNINKIGNPNVVFNSDGTISKITAIVNELYCRYTEGTGVKCQEEIPVEVVYENIGDEVYYDPVNDSMCTTYTESNSASGVIEGCLKWHVLSENNDGTVNLILDHNIVSGVKWYSSEDNSQGPTVAKEALNNAIKDKWSANLVRTDSYTHTFNNGTEDKTYTVSYSGMKARLPEAQEIANAVGHATWNEDTASAGFYFDSKSDTQIVGYGKTQTTSSYAWLFNNLNDGSNANDASDRWVCLHYGCTQNLGKTSGDYGYWTSTSVAGRSIPARIVYYGGTLASNPVADTLGVRPVITLNSN